jgi:hypothetical protein
MLSHFVLLFEHSQGTSHRTSLNPLCSAILVRAMINPVAGRELPALDFGVKPPAGGSLLRSAFAHKVPSWRNSVQYTPTSGIKLARDRATPCHDLKFMLLQQSCAISPESIASCEIFEKHSPTKYRSPQSKRDLTGPVSVRSIVLRIPYSNNNCNWRERCTDWNESPPCRVDEKPTRDVMLAKIKVTWASLPFEQPGFLIQQVSRQLCSCRYCLLKL